jgi:hypothetical protein
MAECIRSLGPGPGFGFGGSSFDFVGVVSLRFLAEYDSRMSILVEKFWRARSG